MVSYERTLELFKQGFSMAEISFERKLAFSTIENHFGILLDKKEIGIGELLSKEKIELIKRVVPENPLSLSEIKGLLPEEVSFCEIGWVLASMGKFRGKKPKAPIVRAINTFVGNHCVRKCFNHPEIMEDCRQKFDKLAKEFGENQISLSEFFKLMNSGSITICKLPGDKKRKIVFWKQFEFLKDENKDFWDK